MELNRMVIPLLEYEVLFHLVHQSIEESKENLSLQGRNGRLNEKRLRYLRKEEHHFRERSSPWISEGINFDYETFKSNLHLL